MRAREGDSSTGGIAPLQGDLKQVRLHASGALLAETFDAPQIDQARWRIWLSDPDRVSFRIEDGRFRIEARSPVFHDGLWDLGIRKTKDVVLAARMDTRSDGPDALPLCLHLCGGTMPVSPDNWVELMMTDLGERARFSLWAAVPRGAFRHESARDVVVPRRDDAGFLAKVELDAGTNLCTASVRTDAGWRQVGPSVELLLRTTHCEIKYRTGDSSGGERETVNHGWFDDVRMYPRPRTNPILVRLIRPDGSPIWTNGASGKEWPPRIRVAGQAERSIEDLEVQLWTADGRTLVSAVQSANMGYYMLPVWTEAWDVFPVAARIRLLLDGKPLGSDVPIPCSGLDGLYPDDVWDLIIA